MHMHIRCVLALLALCALPAHSQEPQRVDADMAAFFTGDWSGAGEFANGKKIAADVNFHPELDGQWLMYTHKDIPLSDSLDSIYTGAGATVARYSSPSLIQQVGVEHQHEADVPHGVDLISVFGGSAPLQRSQAGGG